jgi:signal transduction histidine kinase
MRLWPDTLAGRTLLLLGGSVLIFVIAAGGLLNQERRDTFRSEQRRQLVEQIVNLYRLLDSVEPAQRATLIHDYRRDELDVEISTHAAVAAFPPRRPLERLLNRRLHRALPELSPRGVRLRVGPEGKHEADHGRDRRKDTIRLSLRLHDGQWLNIALHDYQQPPPWARPTLYLLLALLAVIGLTGYWSSRRLSRPMRELAQTAERFGLGQTVDALPERGPREVRETVRAFNRMQERLQRNLRERSLMLAAVSHDLRTPITALRLRAEYIDDTEMRERTLATLTQMESILNDTLAFARDEGRDQHSRRYDLAAMLQTLCDDYSDLGHEVECTLPDRLICTGKPAALQRALTNLIDNALRYGDKVEITLNQNAQGALIEIRDQGPGIPEDKLEDVFTPFYRIEESRSRETGGIGLGLAIARMLIHANGGALQLSNRQPHGLQASVQLTTAS